MLRQVSLGMLTVFVAASGFAAMAWSEEQKVESSTGSAVFQFQLGGEKGEKGEGVVIKLGESSQYWLGVSFEEEDGRLEVEQIVSGSPAAKAGILTEDVVVASGETALTKVAEVQKLIQDSAGKPLSLKILRGGKEITVEVQPERRPVVQTKGLGERGKGEPAQLQLRMQQLAEQARKQAEAGKNLPPNVWQQLNGTFGGSGGGGIGGGFGGFGGSGFAGGGGVGGVGIQPVPDDIEVTLKKKGNNLIQIKVQHGIQTWEVSEREVDKLPEPIRGHVARMLPMGQMHVAMVKPGSPQNPTAMAGGAGRLAPVNPNPDPNAKDRNLQNELQQIKDELRELREKLEGASKKKKKAK